MPDASLPAVPATSVEGVVYDGEVVDEAATAATGAAAASPDASGRSRTVPAILRHLGYVAAGLVVAWRRWRRKRQRHEQVMQALHAQGNHEAMLAWQQQREAERKGRHDRWRALIELVPAI
ncbi:MAG TPA: hypothetical protein VN088_09140, partial [Nocardioides sp.]|nr:hypothetical protein [Nocardioides sp.]